MKTEASALSKLLEDCCQCLDMGNESHWSSNMDKRRYGLYMQNLEFKSGWITKKLSILIVLIAVGIVWCFLQAIILYQPTPESQTVMLELPVRRFQQSVKTEDYDTERDGFYEFRTLNLLTDEIALILIDVWAYHPNDGFMARQEENVRNRIVPLLQAARDLGIVVIHAPHGNPIHPEVHPRDGEIVLNEYDYITVFNNLRNRGIKTLIYAGYASNMCVLVRPIGIIQAKGQNFDVILVRDATIAVEAPESLDGKWAHEMSVLFVELNFGYSTTVNEFQRAAIRIKNPYTQYLPAVSK